MNRLTVQQYAEREAISRQAAYERLRKLRKYHPEHTTLVVKDEKYSIAEEAIPILAAVQRASIARRGRKIKSL